LTVVSELYTQTALPLEVAVLKNHTAEFYHFIIVRDFSGGRLILVSLGKPIPCPFPFSYKNYIDISNGFLTNRKNIAKTRDFHRMGELVKFT